MSSQQGDIGNAGERCRQLRPNVLQHCADTGLVDQYKSFQKRIKAERNAFARGCLDQPQLQDKLRQLQKERAECTRQIEASIRQSGFQFKKEEDAASTFEFGDIRDDARVLCMSFEMKTNNVRWAQHSGHVSECRRTSKHVEQIRMLANSKVETAEEQGRPVQEEELLSEDAPGVQNLYFHDGLGAEVPDAESGYDDGSSAEPGAMQPDVGRSHPASPGVQYTHFSDGMGADMPDAQSGCDDAAPEPAEPVDPELRHALQVYDTAQDVGRAGDLQESVECPRRELAKARTELERLRGLPEASLRQELDEARAEVSRLKCDNSTLWLENQRLVNHNKVLETRLAECSRNAMADPSVQAVCAGMKSLALENGHLQAVVSRQVELNDSQAAHRSQSADARPAKSQKGFGVGDVVYVASEYWHLLGKHPKGYNHKTRFVIVRNALRQGFWDLCAKKRMGIERKEGAGKSLPPRASGYAHQQEQLQSLYQAGHLGDVPARLLSAYPSPPGPARSEYVPFIDLTEK